MTTMDSAENDSPWWILAIVGSTVSWALADLLLDVTIGEQSEDTPHEEDERRRKDSDALSDDISHDATHLTGDQDTAVAGLVTLVIVYIMCLLRWVSHRRLANDFEVSRLNGDFSQSSSCVGGVWSPFHDYEWWVAAVGGVCLFQHYQTLYWAYDTAPSTVINPLLQVSSTWVLIFTAIPAMITGASFIHPFDLFCYAIIVLGGLLPSLEGDVKAMLRVSFWKQDFVKYAVFSEFALGMYDLLLSWVIKTGKMQGRADHGNDPNLLENEFFFLAWCWFLVCFALAYGIHPRLQDEYQGLWRLPPRMVLLAAFGQFIMFVGYYFSQFGYSWFYQASVVHAAEASMAQAFNLITAYIFKRCFNVGRDSAINGMKYKVVSVFIVTIGLVLIAFRELSQMGSEDDS